jgi:dipeptidyl aminopeptidase/acylaminoacyl peptidase
VIKSNITGLTAFVVLIAASAGWTYQAFAAPSGPAHSVGVRDLVRIVRLADPQISPDGRFIALVQIKADLETDKFLSEIALVDVARKSLRPLTRGRLKAGSPRWSPDGGALAFTAPDADKVLQIFVTPMAGGDPLQVTHGKDNVEQFAWSPDGKTLAFATADPKPELKGEDKFKTAFKVGNDDFTIKEAVRPTHLWTIPAAGGEARRLTSGTWSLPSSLPPGPPSSPIKWTPDGKSILIVRQETPSTGDQYLTRIEVVDATTGAIRPLTGATQFEGYPLPSPDGETVTYWKPRDDKPWQFQDAWIAPSAGGPGKDISLSVDKNLYGTYWTPDSKALIVGGNDTTTVGLWRLSLDGKATRLDLKGVMPTNGYWMDVDVGRAGQIAFIGQTATDPDELYLIPSAGAPPIALTQENADLSDLTLGKTETVQWRGPQGRKLDGVVTYPPSYKGEGGLPLVLYVHGGPNSSSRERFNLMPQALAAKGWIVFEPNYRGSDNLDNAFFAAIYKDAGQGPGEDVMAGVAMLKAKLKIDPTRMAVTGWSYGGFMTTWLLGHYNVWKAAVAGAAVTDWVDMYNLSDGNVTQVFATGASPYVGEGMAINRRQSPDDSVTKIRAPTLVMTDMGDFRVPPTQSFGLYRALQDNHVTTELIAIPVDGHFPGDPIRQMDVYQRWIDWLTPYLK